MLWTVFKFLIVVWMLQMVLQFGGSAVHVLFAVSLAALLLRLIIRRTSFSSGSLSDSIKAGRFNAPIAQQLAGASKINSSFHNRISGGNTV
jgi:hypothetical protein